MSLRSIFNRELNHTNRRKTLLNCDHLVRTFKCMREDVKTIYPAFDPNRTDNILPDEIVPLACKFSLHDSSIAAISYEDGTLAVHNTELPGKQSMLHASKYYQNAIFDIAWVPGEPEHILTASANPGISCFNITRDLSDQDTPGGCVIFRGHTATVKTISHRPTDKYVFVSGSRDGTIMIWDRRKSNKSMQVTNPTLLLPQAHIVDKNGNIKPRSKAKILPTSDSSTVASVVFQDEFTFVSAGTRDQHIKVWDLRYLKNGQMKKLFKHNSSLGKTVGYSYISFDHTKTRLYANCMNNHIYEYDFVGNNPLPVNAYTGHRNKSFYIRSSTSPDGRHLVSGSSDGAAYIWSVNRDQCAVNRDADQSPTMPKYRLADIERHELSVAVWNPTHMDRIITLSDNNRAQIWRMRNHAKDKIPLSDSQVYNNLEVCPAIPNKKRQSKYHYRCLNVDFNGDAVYKRKVTSPIQFKIFNSVSNTECYPISPTFSPLKCVTPRKVIVTPRKTRPIERCLPPLNIDSLATSNTATMTTPTSPLTPNKRTRGVKRNLYGVNSSDSGAFAASADCNFDSPSKKLKMAAKSPGVDFTRSLSSPPPPPMTPLTPMTPGLGNRETPTSRRIRRERCTSRFRSPTSNLPDSIRDRSYITTQSDLDNNNCKKQNSLDDNDSKPSSGNLNKDWLTIQAKSCSSPSCKTPTSSKTPTTTPNRMKKGTNNVLTPKIRKSTPRRRLNTTDNKEIANSAKPSTPASIKKFFLPIQRN